MRYSAGVREQMHLSEMVMYPNEARGETVSRRDLIG